MTIIGLCFSSTAHGAAGHNDPLLVLISYVVAVVASFTALEMTERLRGSHGAERWFWRGAAAVALGGGIWSMHFIGMLAFKIPLAQAYDPALTAVSSMVAIGAVAVGLQIVNTTTTWRRVVGAGVLVGLGIAAMHYVGMGALRIPGQIYYRPGLFALSVVVAIVAATVAVWLSQVLRFAWQRCVAALVMALAICGMHYTGMAAVVVVAGPPPGHPLAGVVQADVLAAAVVIGVTILLFLGLVCAFVDRRLEIKAIAEAGRLRALNAILAERTDALTLALAEIDDARRVEAANKAKNELLSSMSHELRTPLNAVLGFAEVMRLKQKHDPLSAGQAEAVGHIIDSGRHLLAQIEAMLELAGLESAQSSFAVEVLDLGSILGDLCADFADEAERAAVTLSWEPCDTSACRAMADRSRVRQVLASVVSNAIKYNRPNGAVLLSVQRQADQIEVTIKDNGAGIPAGKLSSLFVPFNRLGREGGAILGVGVSLAVSKRLVEAMGGALRAESVEGESSTFTVVLPAARAASAQDRGTEHAELAA